MDNNYTNNNNNNNTNLVLGILSAVFGALSLFIFCIPWLTLILAAAGLACGIIALIRIKKEGGQLTLPIIGTAISGVAFIVATVMVVTFHITINELDNRFEEMEGLYNIIRDSIDQWDSNFDNQTLPEPDSTFYIE
ncbi:MAG: hypothetical protein IKP73_09760 [Bacteroidales bacterium]|jgi:hypothetical protein|nr:hypothetical protein [Bacteroidales bacterium]